MSVLKNLIPGQYQFGNLLMGRGTTVPVELFDPKAYDIAAQDFQVSRTSEKLFGNDDLIPTTFEITFDVLNNWLLDENAGLDPETFWAEFPKASDFARLWRGDEYRQMPGEMVPFYRCGKDGITRAIYGRPREFTYQPSSRFSLADACLGSFQRADTLSYTAEETVVEVHKGADPVFFKRESGDVDSWIRIIGYGPLTNPVITVGDEQIRLAITVPAGKMIEISSYPWQRRAVNSDGINLSAYMSGKTQYLDKLKVPIGKSIPLRWTSDELNTWVPALGNSSWLETIQDHNIWDLGTEFETLAGQASVRFDLFNFGSSQFPWLTPSKYLAAIEFGTTTALNYTAKKYNTANQWCQAQIVEPWGGRSALTIMGTDTMSSFVCVEVQSGPFSNYLRIRSGTGWELVDTTVRAQWQNTDLFGWRETDIVAISYDPDTMTYTAWLNGDPKCTWIDSTGIVPTGSLNRTQGYIFNMDGVPFITQGTGFKNIVAYDRTTVPAETGKVFMLWRDAWSTVG